MFPLLSRNADSRFRVDHFSSRFCTLMKFLTVRLPDDRVVHIHVAELGSLAAVAPLAPRLEEPRDSVVRGRGCGRRLIPALVVRVSESRE